MKPFRELTIFEEPLCQKPGKNETQTRFPTITSERFPSLRSRFGAESGPVSRVLPRPIRLPEAGPVRVTLPEVIPNPLRTYPYPRGSGLLVCCSALAPRLPRSCSLDPRPHAGEAGGGGPLITTTRGEHRTGGAPGVPG